MEWWAKMGIRFSKTEDDYIRNHINECQTLYDLLELFNEEFPQHQIQYSNLGKRLAMLGIKKGTHNIRKGKVKSRNPIGTVIRTKGHGARVKTENGYVAAATYFKEKYFGAESKDKKLVHLDGDNGNFSIENLALVSKSIYSSLCWRGWFFKDAELTRTAILTAELLEFFPDLRHNENQYYKMLRSETE